MTVAVLDSQNPCGPMTGPNVQFTHENINPPRTSRISALAALLLLAPAALAAQEAAGTKAPVAHNQVISSNPLAFMFKYGNVEFERKHTGSSTFGLSASSLGFDDATYRNAQVFYRYYPQGAALTSFYIGGRGGVHRVSGRASRRTPSASGWNSGMPGCSARSGTSPSVSGWAPRGCSAAT
ncbi:hypothetical protein BH23ACI1_BH23ACI1_32040 [soil metagenome]